jgi:hypothetical protein
VAVRPSSRYKSDFKDEQRLGKGGFGVVVSVANLLDGLKVRESTPLELWTQ